MSFWRDVQDFAGLYSDGGLVVITAVTEAGTGETLAAADIDKAIYDGQQFDQKGLRTIIQPDSDIVTMITPDILTAPAIWRQHTAVVEKKLQVLDKLDVWAQRSWVLFLVAPIALFMSSISVVGTVSFWSVVGNCGLSGCIYLGRRRLYSGLRRVATPVVRRGVTRYLNNRFQKAIGG